MFERQPFMWFTTSWDDGHPLDRRLADLMGRHGIAGTFYWPITNAEGLPVLSESAMRGLDRDGVEVGSHTLDHAYASRMAPEAWSAQVVAGKQRLEQILGHGVEGFCYPGGKLDDAATRAVAQAGFAYGRTTENLRSDCGSDALRVPTTLQFYPHSRRVLLGNFVRRGHWLRRLTLAVRCLTAASFEQRLHGTLDAAGEQAVVHVWGHSWELDRHGLWPALDRFFAVVAERVPRTSRVTNAGLLRAHGMLR